jgi:hypothetical protein
MRFADALRDGDIDAIRRAPKADLHTHGWACGNRAFLRERTGRDIAPLTKPIASMAEMHAWTDANLLPIIQGREGRLLGLEAAFVQAREDGLTRIELGEDCWAITQGTARRPTSINRWRRFIRRLRPMSSGFRLSDSRGIVRRRRWSNG